MTVKNSDLHVLISPNDMRQTSLAYTIADNYHRQLDDSYLGLDNMNPERIYSIVTYLCNAIIRSLYLSIA